MKTMKDNNGKTGAQVACYVTNSESAWFKILGIENDKEGTIIKTDTEN